MEINDLVAWAAWATEDEQMKAGNLKSDDLKQIYIAAFEKMGVSEEEVEIMVEQYRQNQDALKVEEEIAKFICAAITMSETNFSELKSDWRFKWDFIRDGNTIHVTIPKTVKNDIEQPEQKFEVTVKRMKITKQITP